MPVRGFEGNEPRIGRGAYVHPTADVGEWTEFKKMYVDLARRYREGLGPPLD